jgi:hypothetical protein
MTLPKNQKHTPTQKAIENLACFLGVCLFSFFFFESPPSLFAPWTVPLYTALCDAAAAADDDDPNDWMIVLLVGWGEVGGERKKKRNLV